MGNICSKTTEFDNVKAGELRKWIKNGGDPDKTHESGLSLLHATVLLTEENRVDLLQVLIESDVQVDVTDDVGKTVLHYTANEGERGLPLIKILVEYGANVNAIDNENRTPLHNALQSKDVCEETCLYFINNGADVNAQDKHGFVPLHLAVQRGCSGEIIKALIDNNANINAQNLKKQTPLLLCSEQRMTLEHIEAFSILLHAGADPCLVDTMSNHPVMNMFSALLDYGVQPIFKMRSNSEAVIKMGNMEETVIEMENSNEDMEASDLDEGIDTGDNFTINDIDLDSKLDREKDEDEQVDGMTYAQPALQIAKEDVFHNIPKEDKYWEQTAASNVEDSESNIAMKFEFLPSIITCLNNIKEYMDKHEPTGNQILPKFQCIDYANILHLYNSNLLTPLANYIFKCNISSIIDYIKSTINAEMDDIELKDLDKILAIEKNINMQDTNGRTALHYACWWKNIALVKRILSIEGVDIHIVDNAGQSTGFYAKRLPRDLYYLDGEMEINEYNENIEKVLELLKGKLADDDHIDILNQRCITDVHVFGETEKLERMLGIYCKLQSIILENVCTSNHQDEVIQPEDWMKRFKDEAVDGMNHRLAKDFMEHVSLAAELFGNEMKSLDRFVDNISQTLKSFLERLAQSITDDDHEYSFVPQLHKEAQEYYRDGLIFEYDCYLVMKEFGGEGPSINTPLSKNVHLPAVAPTSQDILEVDARETGVLVDTKYNLTRLLMKTLAKDWVWKGLGLQFEGMRGAQIKYKALEFGLLPYLSNYEIIMSWLGTEGMTQRVTLNLIPIAKLQSLSPKVFQQVPSVIHSYSKTLNGYLVKLFSGYQEPTLVYTNVISEYLEMVPEVVIQSIALVKLILLSRHRGNCHCFKMTSSTIEKAFINQLDPKHDFSPNTYKYPEVNFTQILKSGRADRENWIRVISECCKTFYER